MGDENRGRKSKDLKKGRRREERGREEKEMC